MRVMDAKFVEKLFFPSNVAMACATLIIAYFSSSILLINDVAVTLSAIALYFVLQRIVSSKIKSETKKFSLPALIALVFYVMSSVFLPLTREVFVGAIIIFAMSVVMHIMRDRFMMSSHMMTCVAAITILSWIDIRFLAGAVIIPIVAWNRLSLKRDTPVQVVLGSVLGFAISVAVIFTSGSFVFL